MSVISKHPVKPLKSLALAFAIAFIGVIGTLSYPRPAQAQFAVVCANCSQLVTQVQEFARQILQYAKQVQQYELQLEQYQNMVKNTKSISRSYFDDALNQIRGIETTMRSGTNIMYKLSNLDQEFRRAYPDYQSVFASIEYLDQSTSMNNYAARSAEAMDLARTALLAASRSSQDMQQDQIKMDSIGMQVTGADGNLDALQAAGQYAQHSAQQLMKMRQIALLQVQLQADYLANQQREADLARAQLDYWVQDEPLPAERSPNDSSSYQR
jgi:type IV secretion system protein TrbJ